MRMKLTQLAVVVAAAAGVSTSAFAIDPQSIRIGDGLLFTPTLGFEHGHDDNLFATDKKRKTTDYTVVEPSFKLSLDRAKSAHELKYRLKSYNFHSAKDSSYINHHFTGKTGYEFNARNRLVLNAGYHKMESTSSDTGLIASRKYKNDQWNTKNIGGVYTFGARTARTQVELGADYSELRYDDRRNKGSERDATAGRITGYYAIAPKTRVLLEGRYTDYDYKNNSIRDSKNKALLAGVTWDATAKTTGTIKVGREKKDYDRGSNKSTNMWEAGIDWSPRTYSTFSLKTRRGYDEGNIYSAFDPDLELDSEHVTSSIRTLDTSLGWKHYWTERLYSNASYRRIDRDYQNTYRKDEIDQYGIALTYELRRWLDVGVGYTYRENDSNMAGRDYKRNVYGIKVSASL